MRVLISLTILISPGLSADFTTYVGGDQQYVVQALAVDSAGDSYVTGGYGFVTKLDPEGSIVFTVGIGGPCCAIGYAIAVDTAGNVWVGGNTNSQSLPLVNPLQSTPPAPASPGSGIGFLVKMAPDGTILYSSYFGGVQGVTTVNGIATDRSGNVYLTGSTTASDFPTTPGLPAWPENRALPGTFVTEVDASGQKILYSTVIAGTTSSGCIDWQIQSTGGLGIAVDAAGDAFVAGSTDATDLPVTIGAKTSCGAFTLKINAAGNQLGYLMYLGPAASVVNGVSTSTDVSGRPITADATGNAYIVGSTNSPDFPITPGAYQSSGAGGAFVMKLSPDGATAWATLFGADLNGANALAVSLDKSNNVWLTGNDGFNPGTSGSYLAGLSADGSTLLYSEQFASGEAGTDIAVDPNGTLHVLGQYGFVSTITPAQTLAPRALAIVNAASDQLDGMIAPGEVISIFGTGMGPAVPQAATPLNGSFPTSLGGVQVLANGVPIPLLYVSASQINAEVPSPLNGSANGIVTIQVIYNSATLPDFRLAVVDSDFAPFVKATGSLAVINQDGTLNEIANPAKPGSIVSLWATGFGVMGPPVNGSVVASANNYCPDCQFRLNWGSTNLTETVQYAGTSPGLIDGLMQINFMIPSQWQTDGAWVMFTPPGETEPLRLGWVNISQ
ncbi:MAG TPA: SBBP repeat-containing protein [Bryobacteraceae bacterium]|nr:SBBP repeat-containing protein [Bryobacteraceae bacterium]